MCMGDVPLAAGVNTIGKIERLSYPHHDLLSYPHHDLLLPLFVVTMLPHHIAYLMLLCVMDDEKLYCFEGEKSITIMYI